MLVSELIHVLKELGVDETSVIVDYFGKQAEIGAVYIDKNAAVPVVILSSMDFGSESHEA